MGEADLARLRSDTAAHQPDRRDGMMRGPERPRRQQRPARWEASGGGIDRRHFQRLRLGQWRQDAGQRAGQHGLPGPGTAHKQHVVPAGCRDLQRPFGLLLPQHLRHIKFRRGRLCVLRGTRGVRQRFNERRPLQMRQHLFQALQRVDRQPTNDGGLVGRVLGDEQMGAPRRLGVQGQQQRPAGVAQRTVQRQLAEEQAPGRQRAAGHRHQDPDGDRQIIERPLLRDVGRGEVDGNAALRELEVGVGNGRPDPLLALFDALARQPHDLKRRQPASGGVDLDLDPEGLQPRMGCRRHPHEHQCRSNLIRLSVNRSTPKRCRRYRLPLPVLRYRSRRTASSQHRHAS